MSKQCDELMSEIEQILALISGVKQVQKGFSVRLAALEALFNEKVKAAVLLRSLSDPGINQCQDSIEPIEHKHDHS